MRLSKETKTNLKILLMCGFIPLLLIGATIIRDLESLKISSWFYTDNISEYTPTNGVRIASHVYADEFHEYTSLNGIKFANQIYSDTIGEYDSGSGVTITDNLILGESITAPAGATITEFSTDGTLAGNSDSAVPTEKAAKTYIDTVVVGGDTDAIHDNVSGEINAVAEKNTPLVNDILLIEDSANAYAKAMVKMNTLPVSTYTQDALDLKQNILSEGAFVDGDKTKLDGIETGATADQSASEVANTPAGNIAATDVQAAINELDTEKAADANVVHDTGNESAAGVKDFTDGIKADTISESTAGAGVTNDGVKNKDGEILLQDDKGLIFGTGLDVGLLYDSATDTLKVSGKPVTLESQGTITGSTTATTKLYVDGAISEKTADYTILDADIGSIFVLGRATSADKTFTLPTLSDNLGDPVRVKNLSDYVLTVQGESRGTDAVEDGTTATVINATAHGFVAGQVLEMTSGDESGETRRIASVTTDTITLANALSGAPSATETFEVFDGIDGEKEKKLGSEEHLKFIGADLTADEWIIVGGN